MKFLFIEKYSNQHCIQKMAGVLSITRSGYYSWKKRGLSNRKYEDLYLIDEIKRFQEDSKHSLGSKKITKLIKQKDEMPLGHNRIARLMKENDLNAKKTKRAWKPKEEKDLKARAKNLLNRDFNVGQINRVWTTDITYVRTLNNWTYLCAVMDIGNREIIGWEYSKYMDAGIATRALENAHLKRNYPEGVMIHSDRGTQFCSKEYKKLLKKRKMIQSLSRRGNCWDNACIESFFSSLKKEWLYPDVLKGITETRNNIFEYIEIYYNRKRPHWTLGCLSPIQYLEPVPFRAIFENKILSK